MTVNHHLVIIIHRQNVMAFTVRTKIFVGEVTVSKTNITYNENLQLEKTAHNKTQC